MAARASAAQAPDCPCSTAFAPVRRPSAAWLRKGSDAQAPAALAALCGRAAGIHGRKGRSSA
eukprot:15163578-Alexandrium_andersonii.AAC.1